MANTPIPEFHQQANTATGAERRQAERFSCDQHSFVSEWGGTDNETEAARVHNISTTGIALLTPNRLRPGRVIVIKLKAAGGLSRPLLVRVIHSTQQSDGQWLTGGAFVRGLTEEELRDILTAESAE
jgi:hypothetical protein